MSDHAAAAIGLPDTHRAKHLDRFWVLSEDLLVIATLQGHWIDASPALPRILGWTLEEVQALGGRSITHPADLDASAAQVRKLADGQPVFRFENRVRHKNGTYRCLSWTAVASDGLFYGIGRDITDEKIANARLGLRNQALEAIGQGVVITDPNQPDNPMIYVNPAFQQLTGYTEQQLLGRNCRLLQGPGTDEAALVRLRESLANGTKFSSTLLNYRQDGTSFLN